MNDKKLKCKPHFLSLDITHIRIFGIHAQKIPSEFISQIGVLKRVSLGLIKQI